MGQGSDIKMAQVVAYALSAPVELVKVEENDTTVNANNTVTGGSATSDVLSMGKLGGRHDMLRSEQCLPTGCCCSGVVGV